MRGIDLEKDVPNLGLAMYQPIDEGAYSTVAINLSHYGNLHTTPDGFELQTSPHFRSNMLGNSIQYITFQFFGNNFYGMRLPSVFCAIGIFFLLACSIKELNHLFGENKKRYRIALLVILAYMCADFIFLVASRQFEPSIFRCFFTLLTFYIFLKQRKSKRMRYFWLAFLSIASIFFVYLSNFFVLVIGLFICIVLILQKNKKDFWHAFSFYCLGAVVAFLIAELYYRLVWDTTAIQNLLAAFSTFAQIQDYTVITQNASPILFLKNIAAFFTSNIFFYNPLLLILTLWSLIINLWIVLKKKDLIYAFIIGAILGLLFQTAFSEDYIMRKSLVLLPLLLINVMLAFYKSKDFLKILQVLKPITKYVLFAIFSILIIFILWKSFRVRYDVYIADFSASDLEFLIVFSALQCIGSLLYLYCTFIHKANIKRLSSAAFSIALICVFSSNVYFSFSQVYCNQLYTEKQVALDLGKFTGANYIMGPYVYEYSLYNEIYPLVTTQSQYTEYTNSPLIQYYFDYADSSYEQHINEQIFSESDYRFKLFHTFSRSFIQRGLDGTVGLYKKIQISDSHPYK
ncbi:ArnT family glycosyltransferase [Christensenella intestinihominis]|nr:glycosyltransferase family 39 protein [Christensenella intestinihominis]